MGWAQRQVDVAVADAFGFHAVQLGLPELDGLRANRMPHRWVAHDRLDEPGPVRQTPPSEGISTLSPDCPLALRTEFDALPFPAASIDLVLLPHTLELSRDPHATLAEVHRVLVPEGRVVIVGLNPMSLWGLRQWMGQGPRIGVAGTDERGAHVAEFIGYRRLRDWLKLLSFDIESGRFGCWRPPHENQRWLDRTAWMDRLGSHWWPLLGGLYCLEAVKRVRGMRLVGLSRRPQRSSAAAPAVVTQRQLDNAPKSRRNRAHDPSA